MDETKQQKELFEFERPKKAFPRLADMLPKADFEGRVSITLTLEKIIFITIAIMMLLVVIYAIGIENGKSLSRNAHTTPVEQPVASVKAISVIQPQKTPRFILRQAQDYPEQGRQLRTGRVEGFISTAPIAKDHVSALPGKTPTVVRPSKIKSSPARNIAAGGAKAYTIVAVTLSKRDAAQPEADKLNKSGFSAFVFFNDPYYQVCVGSYPDKANAQAAADLKKIKKIYKDAYFKIR